ncbi:Ethanolamine utilization protein EutH [Tritrichomonas foetus]|uniref:Ethanolamine utilization protein EutH n=1 Tax=Tritrichomonas foetus TaxID=1144522 RepID=A0A1J4KRJ1_9EUKA|nr:Ethanolamine utilization protein EutH [Tritrichomonas foetus]|eukprot:OHT13875.1 Ethanolamine utilization protein EutH [Tritrichomonas foetus]
MSFSDLREAFLNGKVFVESCEYFRTHCDAPLIIQTISTLFMVFAAFDYINNNKYGYGKKYLDAWAAMAPLATAMVGITTLTPVFRLVLTPIISPIFKGLTANPAMFAGTLLDPAMGGLPLSLKLEPNDIPVALYSSCVLGTMLGCTIVFNIPVGLSMIKKENHIFFAYGTLIGILSIPFGCIIGGAAMMATPNKISMIAVLQNLIPILIIAVVIAAFLYFLPFATLNGFMHFSKAITFLMTFGAILAIFQYNTRIKLPLWSTMIDDEGENSLTTVLSTIGGIAVVLTGTMPMVHFITSTFGKYLAYLGRYAGLNVIDSSGLISSIANALPMLDMYNDMSKKGMIFNAAFEVGAAYVLGDHLGYLGSVQLDMIVPMIVGKLFAGLVAIVICVFTGDFFVKKGEEALSKVELETLNIMSISDPNYSQAEEPGAGEV